MKEATTPNRPPSDEEQPGSAANKPASSAAADDEFAAMPSPQEVLQRVDVLLHRSALLAEKFNKIPDLQASGLMQLTNDSMLSQPAQNSVIDRSSMSFTPFKTPNRRNAEGQMIPDLQASGLKQFQDSRDTNMSMYAGQQFVPDLQASGILQPRDESSSSTILDKSSLNFTPSKKADQTKSVLDKSSFNFTPFKTPMRRGDESRLTDILEDYESPLYEAPLEEAEVWQRDTAANKWDIDTCLIRISQKPLSVTDRKVCFKVMDVTNKRYGRHYVHNTKQKNKKPGDRTDDFTGVNHGSCSRLKFKRVCVVFLSPIAL